MLPEVLSAFLGDSLSLINYPAAGTAATGAALALQRVMKRREDAAREVLQSELSKGNIGPLDAAAQDDAVAILFRYARAAQEGAARRNLRLLAQVIRGQLSLGNLVADEFLSYADVLASLRREEVTLLGVMARHRGQLRVADTTDEAAFGIWMAIEAELSGTPLFPTRDHVKASASALVRSGLVLNSLSMGRRSTRFVRSLRQVR